MTEEGPRNQLRVENVRGMTAEGPRNPAPGGKRTGRTRECPRSPHSGWKTDARSPTKPAAVGNRTNGAPVARNTRLRRESGHQQSTVRVRNSTPDGKRTAAEHGARQEHNSGRKTYGVRPEKVRETPLRAENEHPGTAPARQEPNCGWKTHTGRVPYPVQGPRVSSGRCRVRLRASSACR